MINNDSAAATSPAAAAASGVVQSPWKKPKLVSLSRTKSIKRRSELFSTSSNNLNETTSTSQSQNSPNSFERSAFLDDQTNTQQKQQQQQQSQPPASKIFKKTIVNNFSFKNSINSSNNDSTSNFFSYNDASNDKNDLFSFFNGNKTSKPETPKEQIGQPKLKLNDSLASLSPSAINNLSKSCLLGAKETNTSDTNSKETTNDKPTYVFENKNLLPIDWSLKTRLRFLSLKQFSCYNGIKSQHESEALSNYSKFTSFYSSLDKCKYNSIEENKDLFKTLLCESVSYWMFPYLPWLNLFPRHTSGLGSLSSMPEPFNAEIQKSLLKSWNQSFKSLYNSLKSNECPYFYLITHSFLVLFRAQNIGGVDEMHAILTPSTKGLRQALKDINFTMPLMSNGKKTDENGINTSGDHTNGALNESSELHNSIDHHTNTTTNNNHNGDKNETSFGQENDSISNNCLNTSSESKKARTNGELAEHANNCSTNSNSKLDSNENDDENDENDENDEDSDEPDEWLEQIGLNSAVNFKASVLQRNSKNKQKNSLLNFDNRPKSTLLFTQGSDVQALFNFLLNSKSCILNCGPMAGIPPTLLSPTTFVNATLQKIKVEQNIVKSLTSTGQSLTQYTLDFIGPIMPYHIHRLCNLFRITQSGEYEMLANVYDQSAPFNCVKKQDDKVTSDGRNDNDDDGDDYLTNNKKSKFLDSSELKSIEESFGIYGESQSIKSIHLKDEKFCCNY